MKFVKSSRGDTIVEVLIATAVLSLILSVSYGLANRSSLITRQAQERSEALKINESELESLKAYLSDSTHTLPATGALFCMNGTNILTLPAPTPPPTNANPQSDTLANYPPECAKGTDGRYKNIISLGTDGAYTAATRWERVTGNGKDQVTMAYKVYLASAATIDLSGFVNNCPAGRVWDAGSGTCVLVCPANMHDGGAGICVFDPCPLAAQGQIRDGAGNCVADDCPNIPLWQGPGDPAYYKVGADCYPHYNISVPPNSYWSCTAWEPVFNDGADGCKTSGAGISSPSMFAWRNIAAVYTLPNVIPNPGQVNIEIKYRQYNNSAPANYSYSVRMILYSSFNLFSLGSDDTFSLPAGPQGTQQTFNGTAQLQLPGGFPMEGLIVYWTNNIGNDPNLQIDSIRFYR